MEDVPMSGASRSLRVLRAASSVIACLTLLASVADAAPARRKRAASKPAVAPPAAAAPAAPVPPVNPAREAWARARALAQDEKHDEALAVIREALTRFPDDTDLLWLEANVTGWAGRHDEAVTKFESLVARHPELARDVRADLAAERLWKGDPQGAIRDFDQRLVDEPSDRDSKKLRALALSQADRLEESLAAYDVLLAESPGDVDLALERARVLGWLGRHLQAIAAYRAILESHPGETRARIGLAQNENWRGDHRRAAALYEELESEKVDDPDVQRGLAWAYYWSGQPDRSRTALGQFLTLHPDDSEGRRLATMLAREDSPHLTLGYERADDSDALRVRSTVLDYRHPFAGRNAFLASWRKDDVQDEQGDRTPWRAGAGLEPTWSARWSGRIMLWYVKPSHEEKAYGLGEVGLVNRPTDRLRIDVGWEKNLVLTRQSLAENVRVNVWVAGFDWQADERLLIHADERFAYYNDENRQIRFSGSARVPIPQPHGEVALTMGVEHLQSRFDLDHGYYDPSRYLEFGPGFELMWRPAERYALGFAGKLGWQNERYADREPFQAFTATAEVPIGEIFQAHVEGGQSDSNLSSASGFRRKRWAAYLTTGF
jgi:tetratricopeptide (TPR) repeat protein